jgi:hypothetical protein
MKMDWLIGVALVPTLGCSAASTKCVPVSGVVTLDGKPLANAIVAFSPIAKPGEVNAGDGATGKTNANGEYSLTTSRGMAGAQTGNYRVRISALSQNAGEGDKRPPRGGWPVKDKVPARYSENTPLTFEVTPNGPNKADFDLTTK